MKLKNYGSLLWIGIFLLLIPAPGLSEITQLVIQSSEPFVDKSSGGSGVKYVKLKGYAIGELDPSNPLNACIVNLNRAPLNEHGRVQYRTEVEILKPVGMGAGNGTLFYDVVNRGKKVTWPKLSYGYTIVWSGWQADLPKNPKLLKAQFPVPSDHGHPIVGLSREEFVDMSTGTFVGSLSYPAADLDTSHATLTVREKERDQRKRIDSWRYLNDHKIKVTTPGGRYDSGAIYEFIYKAKDPVVMGIGFAATRDLNSFLRYELKDSVGHPNPLADESPGPKDPNNSLPIKRAIIEGVSQSGRFTRDFLWQGFNEDEKGRQVFDGAMAIIAGSRKTFTNFEFARPGYFSRQHEEHLQPGDQFPFTYGILRDPLTEKEDGILAKCIASHTCPKIIHIDGEFEYWAGRGSLVVTDGDPAGPHDISLPPNVRVYLVAGTPHGGPGKILPPSHSRKGSQNLLNPLGSLAVVPAMIQALNDWISTGKEPPPSSYGSVSKGLLVEASGMGTGFPKIPGVAYTGLFNSLRDTDYGVQPPKEGREYGVLVPRCDRDGNSLAGIRLPPLQVPIATYTGWNLRAAGHAEGENATTRGSFIPFAKTKAERLARGDPRLSIEERYSGHAEYVQQLAKAARELVGEGYLLSADANDFVKQANSRAVKRLFEK